MCNQHDNELVFPSRYIFKSVDSQQHLLRMYQDYNLKRGISFLWQGISLLLKLFSKLVIAHSTLKEIIVKQNGILRLICKTKRGTANLQAYLQWRWNSSVYALRIPDKHKFTALYDYGLMFLFLLWLAMTKILWIILLLFGISLYCLEKSMAESQNNP